MQDVYLIKKLNSNIKTNEFYSGFIPLSSTKLVIAFYKSTCDFQRICAENQPFLFSCFLRLLANNGIGINETFEVPTGLSPFSMVDSLNERMVPLSDLRNR